MKSPINGKKMSIHKELRQIEFRKEKFDVIFHYYLDEDNNERFTTTELDEVNMNQVYNEYRWKHKLPFPEEIKAIRAMYNLPTTKMSEILGFGINSYRNYENSEIPSNANGKLIALASDPTKFKQLVQIAEHLDPSSSQKLIKKIDYLIEDTLSNKFNLEYEHYLFDGKTPDEYSGYKKPDFKKLTEMVVFFTGQLEPWKTQMNKLLFYADFLLFKRTCFSMSGIRYRAIGMGPAPTNYNSIFEYMLNRNDISISQTKFSQESVGDQFKLPPSRIFNENIFSEIELKTLNDVVRKFKGKNTKDIIEISHQEKAWKINEKERGIISYKHAFDLIYLD